MSLNKFLHRHPLLKSENELLERCKLIEGFTLSQLARALGLQIPSQPAFRKGWVGQAIERALGTTAGTQAKPDFSELGIELKTLPLNHLGRPAESTFITTIPLLTVHKETWKQSLCFLKLKRVLWIPIESDQQIPFHHRRIGQALLWSPSEAQEAVLSEDWHELTLMIGTGRLEKIDASIGRYLQVRPKAATGKSLCYGYDETGQKIQTLPRGFYLRSRFTAMILGQQQGG